MSGMHWEPDGPGRWAAVVNYSHICVVQVAPNIAWAAEVWCTKPQRLVQRIAVADTPEIARTEADRLLACCAFCGSRWRCCGGREPSTELRARRLVGGRAVYSSECEALDRARQAMPLPTRLDDVAEVDGIWMPALRPTGRVAFVRCCGPIADVQRNSASATQ